MTFFRVYLNFQLQYQKFLTKLTLTFDPFYQQTFKSINVIIYFMNTPPRNTSQSLNSKDPSSIKKTKALNRLIDTYLIQNYSRLNQGSSYKIEPLYDNLQNSKAFFESEMNMLIKMIERMKKLYSQKESQNYELKHMIEQYEKKLQKERTQEIKQTINKNKMFDLSKKTKEQIQRKTLKKNQTQICDIFKDAESAISEFRHHIQTKDNKRLNNSLSSAHRQRYKESQNQRRNSQKQVISHTQNTAYDQSQLRQQNYQLKNQVESTKEELKQVIQQKQKIFIELSIIQQKYCTLQKQYNNLENQHGKMTAQYEIKLQNLREILRGIKQHSSPKKQSQKDQEGYYSIYRPLNRNPSQQSCFSSSNNSNLSQVNFNNQNSLSGSLVQLSLKQQNQYLRDQLIKNLDEKGSIKSKLIKYQKLVEKYEKQKRQKSKFSTSLNEQNDMNQSNSLYKKSQTNLNTNSFKKNKTHHTYLVENTINHRIIQSQNQTIQNQKFKELIDQICHMIGYENEYYGQDTLIQTQQKRIQWLERLIIRVKEFGQQKKKIQTLLDKFQRSNLILQKQKRQIIKKSQRDLNEVKTFLKEINDNKSISQSSDSTDKAFKNIQLINNNKLVANQKNSDLMINGRQKNIQYLEKINSQQVQIENLQNKLFELSQRYHKLTNLPSQSQQNIGDKEQLPIKTQKSVDLFRQHQITKNHIKKCQAQNLVVELSHFELFQQKLTEFYQQTIRELNDWKVQALRGLSPKNHQTDILRYNMSQLKLHKLENSQKIIQGQNHKILKDRQTLQDKRIPQDNQVIQENQNNNQKFSPNSIRIIKRNILKVSQQFRSIEENNLSQEAISKQVFNNQMQRDKFNQRRMSRSFIAEDQTLSDIINKKVNEFQKYSSALIDQIVLNQNNEQKDKEQNAEQNQIQLNYQDIACFQIPLNRSISNRKSVLLHLKSSKTERSNKQVKVEHMKQYFMNEVDAKSQSISQSQLMKQRNLWIRQKVSYFVEKSNPPSNMSQTSHSIKKYQSQTFNT